MWARLLFCTFFVLSGAIYSHGEELHDHSSKQNLKHHVDGVNKIETVTFTPHNHVGQTGNGAQESAPGIHCGSPELQPMELTFYRSVVFAELIKPALLPLMASAWLGLEPPPPRT